jgi:hypothetical protein
MIARAEVGDSVQPSPPHGATNPPAHRVEIDRGRTSHRERVAGARSLQAPATGRGAASRAIASRGTTSRRRPMIGRGRPNPQAPALSGSRGSASRRGTRRAAIDRGTRSGPRAKNVPGPRSRRVRHEAIGRGAPSRRPRAIASRGRTSRSGRAVRQNRTRETAARTCASVATMNRPIATDMTRAPQCVRVVPAEALSAC